METRGLDDEMGEGWKRLWGGGVRRETEVVKIEWKKKYESFMHVTFLCLFLIYTYVADLKWNMSLSSFVFHLSEYHADIHTHFHSILNRCDYDGNLIFVVLNIWGHDELQDIDLFIWSDD